MPPQVGLIVRLHLDLGSIDAAAKALDAATAHWREKAVRTKPLTPTCEPAHSPLSFLKF